MSRRFPLIIGEWCIDTTSTKPARLGREERVAYFRALAEAQLAAWQDAEGWFFWSYKVLVDGPGHDGWDMGKSFELGYLPAIAPPSRDAPSAHDVLEHRSAGAVPNR